MNFDYIFMLSVLKNRHATRFYTRADVFQTWRLSTNQYLSSASFVMLQFICPDWLERHAEIHFVSVFIISTDGGKSMSNTGKQREYLSTCSSSFKWSWDIVLVKTFILASFSFQFNICVYVKCYHLSTYIDDNISFLWFWGENDTVIATLTCSGGGQQVFSSAQLRLSALFGVCFDCIVTMNKNRSYIT